MTEQRTTDDSSHSDHERAHTHHEPSHSSWEDDGAHLVGASPDLPAMQATIEEREVAIGAEAGLWSDAFHVLRRNPVFLISGSIILIFLVMALFPQAFVWFYPGTHDVDYCSLSLSSNTGGGRPSSEAWFGYDIQGCDYYLRTIYGARTSISIGVIVTIGALIIALVFGSISGYYGKLTDTLISRLTDVWFAIPTLLFAIVLLSVVDEMPSWIPFLDGTRGIAEVSFVLILAGWPGMLRLMRSSVIANKEHDYVSASRALGASNYRIIRKHVLPNALAPVIVYATIYVGVIISAEAALSFLGIGLQLPAISWGLMINTATAQITNIPHLLFFPGLFLSITVLSFILMGDALRDALDPKLR
jgi:ABC-type dipeptide/oligopeptide/nickel transport system permease subunit